MGRPQGMKGKVSQSDGTRDVLFEGFWNGAKPGSFPLVRALAVSGHGLFGQARGGASTLTVPYSSVQYARPFPPSPSTTWILSPTLPWLTLFFLISSSSFPSMSSVLSPPPFHDTMALQVGRQITSSAL